MLQFLHSISLRSLPPVPDCTPPLISMAGFSNVWGDKKDPDIVEIHPGPGLCSPGTAIFSHA